MAQRQQGCHPSCLLLGEQGHRILAVSRNRPRGLPTTGDPLASGPATLLSILDALVCGEVEDRDKFSHARRLDPRPTIR